MRVFLKAFSVLAVITTVLGKVLWQYSFQLTMPGGSLSNVDGSTGVFLLTFWDDLRAALGPIYDYLILPVIQVFENPSFRSMVISTLTWACVVVAGLVFIIYEWPDLLSFVTGSSTLKTTSAPPSAAPTRRTAQPASTAQPTRAAQSSPAAQSAREPQRRTWSAWSETPKASEKPAPQAKTVPVPVPESEVKITSKIEKKMDDYVLTVAVNNTSSAAIAMVVVEVVLPLGVDMSVGSFRMHRIGTINGGTIGVAAFRIRSQGGDLRAITGTVEYLSPGHDVSKAVIPPPEIAELQ
ncbi:MAG: hypothetical protein C4K49_12580 [Candidatus Thorarchaeota archaeon]|nr:MAG: hypothetical protein C4K49_12580 [Candidatus Thorarchaeota archaeon]